MVKRSRREASTTHFKLMSNINKTAKTTVENETSLRQATTGVVFTLAPFVVVAGFAAISVTAVAAYSSTANCSTDFGGNLMCLTTW